VRGQGKELRNPVAGDAKAIQLGKAYFRTRCGPCHGIDARGGAQGPDLISGRRVHGDSDADVYRIVTQGIAGTSMPANDLPDAQVWAILAYLRAQSAASHPPVPGDRARGKDLFFGRANCASCHMVNGQGGRLGPDLSRVGASRSIQYLTDSIREPSKDLSEGLPQIGAQAPCPVIYDTVTVVTGDGRRITGVARNEDNYSLQMMDVSGELHMFMKKDLQEVVHERKSLMPAYDESALSKAELQDLLAYLQSLQGSGVGDGRAAKALPAKGLEP
jgi:putative heme-binding domain-containing protein